MAYETDWDKTAGQVGLEVATETKQSFSIDVNGAPCISDSNGKSARFTATKIELGLDADSSSVELCGATGVIKKDVLGRLSFESVDGAIVNKGKLGSHLIGYSDDETHIYSAQISANSSGNEQDFGDGTAISLVATTTTKGGGGYTQAGIVPYAPKTGASRLLVMANGLTEDLADWVIETGTDGIWTYEKWASGKMVCFGKSAGIAVTTTNAYGYTFYGSFSAVAAIPAGWFVATPKIWTNYAMNSNGLVSSVAVWQLNTSATSIAITVHGPSSQTGMSIICDFYCIGRWKA